jgi:predicted O-methyltransferase YrrM
MAAPDPAAEDLRRLLGARGDGLLRELERDAQARGLAVMGPSAAGFVASLARVRGGRDLLELGTATGYSSVWLGRVARELGGKVTTVERDAALVQEARANLLKAGLDGVVQVVHGDAFAFLEEPGDRFDLVLLDIVESEYAAALKPVGERLKPRGVLVANHAGSPRAREFNSLALSDERFDVSLLYGFWPGHAPEWDTLTVAVRRESPAGARAGPLG